MKRVFLFCTYLIATNIHKLFSSNFLMLPSPKTTKRSSTSWYSFLTSRDFLLVLSIPFIVLTIFTIAYLYSHSHTPLPPKSNNNNNDNNFFAGLDIHFNSNNNYNDKHDDSGNKKRKHFRQLLEEHHHHRHNNVMEDAFANNRQEKTQNKNTQKKSIPFEKCGSVREDIDFIPYHHLHHHQKSSQHAFVTIVRNEDDAFSAALLFYSIYRTRSTSARRIAVIDEAIGKMKPLQNPDVLKMISIFGEVVEMNIGSKSYFENCHENQVLLSNLAKVLLDEKMNSHQNGGKGHFYKFVLLDRNTIVYRNIDDLFDMPSNSFTRIHSDWKKVGDDDDNILLSSSSYSSTYRRTKLLPANSRIRVCHHHQSSPQKIEVTKDERAENNILSPWYLVRSGSAFDQRIRAFAFEDDDASLFSSSRNRNSIGKKLQEEYQPYLCYFDRTRYQIEKSFEHKSAKEVEGGVPERNGKNILMNKIGNDPEFVRFSILQMIMRKLLEYAAGNDRIEKLPDSWLTMFDDPRQWLKDAGVVISQKC